MRNMKSEKIIPTWAGYTDPLRTYMEMSMEIMLLQDALDTANKILHDEGKFGVLPAEPCGEHYRRLEKVYGDEIQTVRDYYDST